MDKLFVGWDKTKKEKHEQYCYNQRRHSFFLSVDGMMGEEALVVLTTLSLPMSVKMDKPIYHIIGWVNGRTVVSVASSYSRLICGAQAPIPLWTQKLEWASGSRFFLAQ